ncbi:MAG: KOW motif-containing protein [Anaerolineae bacterium]|nr:KOW motif-containing protein [Anaerolineae bacterium]MCX8068672.1 KOW motif-containing protein [Anaerolineae bacterium]MDW7991451.1 KOW motif-containing protein [Anaerolineae bacterium]
MRVYTPSVVVSPLVLIRRERRLPAPGDILVREGDRVEAVQIIGQAFVPGEFRILNLAEALGVSRRAVQRYLKVKPGQEVRRGDVLAARGGLSPRVCRAPMEGTVTGIGGGRLILEAPAQVVEVRAGCPGLVRRVIPREGVILQVSGALIQGAWGNGQEEFGVLRLLTDSRDKPLRARHVDASCRGAILVAGLLNDEEALQQAVEIQVRGIIVGGLAPELLDRALAVPFPVVTTEGIGPIPMSEPAFRLLSTYNGREAALDGRIHQGRDRRRPEIIIPLPAEPKMDALQFQPVPLRVGDTVRIIRAPHRGRTGIVKEILPTAARGATGSHLPAAKVQVLGEEEPLVVPIFNLEVLRS